MSAGESGSRGGGLASLLLTSPQPSRIRRALSAPRVCVAEAAVAFLPCFCNQGRTRVLVPGTLGALGSRRPPAASLRVPPSERQGNFASGRLGSTAGAEGCRSRGDKIWFLSRLEWPVLRCPRPESLRPRHCVNVATSQVIPGNGELDCPLEGEGNG